MKKQKTPVKAIQHEASTPESRELKTIVRFILSRIRTEKIICFGSIVNNVKNTSCFLPDDQHLSPKQNSYYLLIVPAKNEQVPDILIQQRLEEELKTFTCATIIVHRMKEINMALEKGSSFFSNIYKKGALLHDSESEPFIVPATGIDRNGRILKREQFWNQWHQLSENFLIGAQFYYEHHFNNLAVFMLHQSLQHCYCGMLRVMTGYRSNSNSLRRLLKLIDNVLPGSSFSPVTRTPENARLLGLLMKGFNEARYSNKFDITHAEVGTLLARIGKILTQANTTCLEHLKNLKEGKAAYAVA